MDTLHLVLGAPRLPAIDADRCSKCEAPIGAEPLVIYCDGGRRVWVFCKDCEATLLATFATLQWPPPIRKVPA